MKVRTNQVITETEWATQISCHMYETHSSSINIYTQVEER